MPKGGLRTPAGGRPKGSRDKKPRRIIATARVRERTEDVLDQLAKAEALELPLDRLLRRMNDTSLSEVYRDKLAAVAINFTNARLTSVAVTRRPAQMSDEDIQRMLGLLQEDLLRAGQDRDRFPYVAIEHSPGDPNDEVKH
jgi:hypothetical protein